ncbi:MAG: phosphonate ABC transporter, permease protein PhnE [Rhodomicrobium sp.]|nr:phosphonate ABC transporter, permease protein PhnE [Rhodomicrobium sp.]
MTMSQLSSGPAASSDLAHIVIPVKPLSQRLKVWLVWVATAGLLVWSWGPSEMFRAVSLVTDWHNMAEFAAGYAHPNFHEWRSYLSDMIVTVQIAIWGTALAVIFGIPFSILCSANICPQWIVQPCRRLMDTCRAINELVFALFFVVAVGLGPFAGVMALFIHNLGVIAKLFSEAVEAIDPRPVEGIRATGASRLREVIFGVIPQVAPLWTSLTLYRLETNVRSATTLGIVGAGGIGQTLYESIRSFLYSETAAQIIIIVITVVLIDLVSARLRKGLV